MKWNKSEYGNIEDIRMPPSKLWKPDVLMYNRYYVVQFIDLLKNRHFWVPIFVTMHNGPIAKIYVVGPIIQCNHGEDT